MTTCTYKLTTEYVICSNPATAQSIARAITARNWPRLYTKKDEAQNALDTYPSFIKRYYKVWVVRCASTIDANGCRRIKVERC